MPRAAQTWTIPRPLAATFRAQSEHNQSTIRAQSEHNQGTIRAQFEHNSSTTSTTRAQRTGNCRSICGSWWRLGKTYRTWCGLLSWGWGEGNGERVIGDANKMECRTGAGLMAVRRSCPEPLSYESRGIEESYATGEPPTAGRGRGVVMLSPSRSPPPSPRTRPSIPCLPASRSVLRLCRGASPRISW